MLIVEQNTDRAHLFGLGEVVHVGWEGMRLLEIGDAAAEDAFFGG